MTATGSCLCGTIKYTVDGPLRDITACHCTQCRKQSGHFYAATSAADADLVIEGGDNLTWYEASDDAKRGFCKSCGSALFWKLNSEDKTSILAGSLDNEAGVKLIDHIFVADKGDYYEIKDGVPAYPKGRGS